MDSDKLSALIEQGGLNPVETDEFISACEYLTPEDRDLLGDVFEDDPATVRIMYENYKLKREAFGSDNPDVWANLLRDEEYQLEEVKDE